MADPICEIKPFQPAVSNCGIRFPVRTCEDGTINSIGASEKCGTAWGKGAKDPEHIAIDETWVQICWSVVEHLLKLFTRPRKQGNAYLSVDKHFLFPGIPSFSPYVYTASAYIVEGNRVEKVKTEGWPTAAKAIEALLSDIKWKIALMESCPEHPALDDTQIAKPFRSFCMEYLRYAQSLSEHDPSAGPQGLKKAGIGYHGDATNESNNMFSTTGVHQDHPTASLPQQMNPVQDPLHERNISTVRSGALTNYGSLLDNEKFHLNTHQDWSQTVSQHQFNKRCQSQYELQYHQFGFLHQIYNRHQIDQNLQPQQFQQYQFHSPYQLGNQYELNKQYQFHQPLQSPQYQQPAQVQQYLQFEQPQQYQQPGQPQQWQQPGQLQQWQQPQQPQQFQQPEQPQRSQQPAQPQKYQGIIPINLQSDEPLPKRPGRPPKHLPVQTAPKLQTITPTPKRRGRPPKNKTAETGPKIGGGQDKNKVTKTKAKTVRRAGVKLGIDQCIRDVPKEFNAAEEVGAVKEIDVMKQVDAFMENAAREDLDIVEEPVDDKEFDLDDKLAAANVLEANEVVAGWCSELYAEEAIQPYLPTPPPSDAGRTPKCGARRC